MARSFEKVSSQKISRAGRATWHGKMNEITKNVPEKEDTVRLTGL
jgi:hypothetical protein